MFSAKSGSYPEEAMATLSARSAQRAETKPVLSELLAQLEELPLSDQLALLAHSPGLQYLLPQTKVVPGHTVGSNSVEQGSPGRQRYKRDADKKVVPWRPAGPPHMQSACTLAESETGRDRHRRGFCISKTPLSARCRAGMTAGSIDKHAHAMHKVLYWDENRGSFLDGGTPGDAEDIYTTVATSLFKTCSFDPGRSSRTALGFDEVDPPKRTVVLPPNWEIWGYKLVAKVGRRYFSLWAGESAEYEMGLPIANEALPDRKGGLYICDSPTSAARQYVATSFPGNALCVAMLRCACRGPFIDYGGGKAACSALTPLGEVPLPTENDTCCPRAGLWQRLHATPIHAGADSNDCGRMSTMPGWTVVGYTVAARLGRPPLRERYFSLWTMEASRYDLGVPVQDDSIMDPTKDHLCVVSSPAEASSVRIAIAEKLRGSGVHSAPRVLLRCSCEGPFVELLDGRVACSRLTPLEEVSLPNLHHEEGWQTTEFIPAPPLQPRPGRPSPRQQGGAMQAGTKRSQRRMRPSSAPQPHRSRRVISPPRCQ